MRYTQIDAKMSPTGRMPSEPEIQNLPGTLAHKIEMAGCAAREVHDYGTLDPIARIGIEEIRRRASNLDLTNSRDISRVAQASRDLPITEAREALANFLEARRSAKPRVRPVRRLGVYQIEGMGLVTYGLTIENAYKSWYHLNNTL